MSDRKLPFFDMWEHGGDIYIEAHYSQGEEYIINIPKKQFEVAHKSLMKEGTK